MKEFESTKSLQKYLLLCIKVMRLNLQLEIHNYDGNFFNIANPLNSVYVYDINNFVHIFTLFRFESFFPYLTDCVNETI